MHPVQIAVLIALVGGSVVYAGYRIRRDVLARREFFRLLVEQLSRVLLPKGLHLMERYDSSRSARGTVAIFEGPVFSLEVFWDIVDSTVFLLARETELPRSQHRRIASAHLPVYAKADVYTKATADLVEAATRSDNAFLKPARFEVHNVFQITNRGRVVSGTIVAGRFRVGTRVWAEQMPAVSFTISDVGFLDDRRNHRAWVTFCSEDAPPMTELRQVLPPGSILTDAEPLVVIRAGVATDAPALAELAARTFHETFAGDNTPEDMGLHSAQAYGTSQQQKELADPDIATLLVDVDGQLAGYAQLRAGMAPECVTGEEPIELWRFYIARPWHGLGFGQSLMQRVESEAYARGAHTLWLGVWEHNERAKAFYRKSGFVDVGSHVFTVGMDAQTDRIMIRSLRELGR